MIMKFRPKIFVVSSPFRDLPENFYTTKAMVNEILEAQQVETLSAEYIPTIDDTIVEAVCDQFQTTREELMSHTRKREIVQARQVGMYLMWLFTSYSLSRIGDYFGGKDHATVIHAKNTVTNLAETDKNFNSMREAAIVFINNRRYEIQGSKKLKYSQVETLMNDDRRFG